MAQLSVEMTGDDVKLWKSLQKVVAQQNKVGKGLDDINRKGKAAGKGVSGAMGGIGKSMLALAGPAAVFTMIARYANKAQQEIQGVAGAMAQAEAGMKTMWQVSTGHADYAKLSLAVKKGMAAEGIDRALTTDMAFTLKGKGLQDQLLAVGRSGRFMDPAVATNFYTMLSDPVNFGRGVTVPRAMSALIAGAGPSDFNTTQTAQLMNKVAPTMKSLGSSVAEMLAVGSVLSVTSDKSPEIAATRMIAGAKIIDREGFGGQGILKGFKALREADPEAYLELKRQNVQFKQFALGLEGEGAGIAASRIPGIRDEFNNPTLYAAKVNTPAEITLLRASRVAAAQRELSLEQAARSRMRLDTAVDRNVALTNLTGGSFGGALLYEDALKAGATFGMTQAATIQANRSLFGTIRREFPGVYAKHLEGVFDMRADESYVPLPGGTAIPMAVGPPRPVIPAVLTDAQSAALTNAVAAAVQIGLERQGEQAATVAEAEDAKMRRQAELIGDAVHGRLGGGEGAGKGYELRRTRADDRPVVDVW